LPEKKLEVNKKEEEGTAIEATLCTRVNQLIYLSTAINRARRCHIAEVAASSINHASTSAAHAEQVLPPLLVVVVVAADTAEAAASCGDQAEASLYVPYHHHPPPRLVLLRRGCSALAFD
jgi:hypothetical protein